MELSGSLFHGAWLIVFSLMDSYTLAELKPRLLIYLPMMVFPESMLNGWIAAILVGFKPHWVGSFNDAEYIKGNDPLLILSNSIHNVGYNILNSACMPESGVARKRDMLSHRVCRTIKIYHHEQI